MDSSCKVRGRAGAGVRRRRMSFSSREHQWNGPRSLVGISREWLQQAQWHGSAQGPPRTRAHAPSPQSGSRWRPAPRLIAGCSAAQRGATRLLFCSGVVGAGESWAWRPEEGSAGKLRAGLERHPRLRFLAFKACPFAFEGASRGAGEVGSRDDLPARGSSKPSSPSPVFSSVPA